MLKFVFYFFILLLSMRPLSMGAQSVNINVANDRLNEEKASFLKYLNPVSIDSNIVNRLVVFIVSESDSIYNSVITDNTLSSSEKTKAILSLVSFMNELREKMSLHKFEIYEIPEALRSFKLILNSLVYHQAFAEILSPLSPQQSRLMATSSWRYSEYDLLNDITVYKQVVSTPEHILQFLEKNPNFRFADSLLLQFAAYNPLKLQTRLLQNDSVLLEKVHNNQNIYLKQIVSLAGNRDAPDLLPFTVLLAENRITTEEILEKRKDAPAYFQLLVNAFQHEINNSSDSSFLFLTTLRNGIKEKALSFYVNQVNDMHNSPAVIRFASVKELRAEDLYYIITSCGEELYTSSYLGLYQLLMEQFRIQPTDSLFRLVQYDNFRIFMRMAANYNTLADFLSCMSKENLAAILNRFMSGIERDTNNGLEKAMDIADSFTGVSSDSIITGMIQTELDSNFNHCLAEQNYFGIRIYSILLQVFDLVKQKDSLNKLWSFLGNHDFLERSTLLNKKGEITELVLFYGDEDGVASFGNFMKLFSDSLKWQISANQFWVTIRSLSDQPLVIYANLPFDTKQEFDIQAQDSLFAFLDQQSTDPVILIHRGHSYHLDKTLQRLQPSVKLAILGSCGGHNSILSVAKISPDAQIIVSQKTGSMIINDPLIDVINETLQNKNDLVWTEVWEKLAARFGSNDYAKYLFNEYIPPGKNVSLFVLKLFNYYR